MELVDLDVPPAVRVIGVEEVVAPVAGVEGDREQASLAPGRDAVVDVEEGPAANVAVVHHRDPAARLDHVQEGGRAGRVRDVGRGGKGPDLPLDDPPLPIPDLGARGVSVARSACAAGLERRHQRQQADEDRDRDGSRSTRPGPAWHGPRVAARAAREPAGRSHRTAAGPHPEVESTSWGDGLTGLTNRRTRAGRRPLRGRSRRRGRRRPPRTSSGRGHAARAAGRLGRAVRAGR